MQERYGPYLAINYTVIVVPGCQLHRDIGTTHGLSILDGQTGDGESQEADDRAEPADRGSDMHGERELAEAG